VCRAACLFLAGKVEDCAVTLKELEKFYKEITQDTLLETELALVQVLVCRVINYIENTQLTSCLL
jgi:hypothetical protein